MVVIIKDRYSVNLGWFVALVKELRIKKSILQEAFDSCRVKVSSTEELHSFLAWDLAQARIEAHSIHLERQSSAVKRIIDKDLIKLVKSSQGLQELLEQYEHQASFEMVKQISKRIQIQHYINVRINQISYFIIPASFPLQNNLIHS